MKYLRVVINTCIDFLFPPRHDDARLAAYTPEYFARHAKLAPQLSLPDAFAIFSYRDPLIRTALWSLKYRRNRHMADIFGTILASHLTEELAERQQFGEFLDPLIIPIPLHKDKERKRGFNQALLIAQALARALALEKNISINALIRTINTESLARGTSRTARYERMRHAFSVPDANSIRNRDIILVDDVITSGATASSARDTLLAAGARRVFVVAVAH